MLCVACSGPPAEQRLRDAIASLEQAIEQREPRTAMAFIEPDFAGPGGMTREELRNLMRAQLVGRAAVGVTTGPKSIHIVADRAEVRFEALLTGSAQSSFGLPDSARGWRVTTTWQDDGSQWRLLVADWSPLQ